MVGAMASRRRCSEAITLRAEVVDGALDVFDDGEGGAVLATQAADLRWRCLVGADRCQPAGQVGAFHLLDLCPATPTRALFVEVARQDRVGDSLWLMPWRLRSSLRALLRSCCG